MKKLLRRSKAAQHLFHLSLVFSFLLLGTTSSWAIVVTNTNNSGAFSFRQAIIDANADGIASTITFDPVVFPAAAPATIFVTSQLPALTDPRDTIDGAGSGVILDGSSTAAGDVGIRVRASNITIQALTIQNFPGEGIHVQPGGGASGVSITGVLITGNTILNNQDGLRVSGQSGPGNTVQATISSNKFDQNRDDGIFVRGSSGNPGDGGNIVEVLIDNNRIFNSIGTETGGERTGDGIRVNGAGGDGSANTVRATISGNNIKDNADDGILVSGAGGTETASNNTVETEIVGNIVIGPGRHKKVEALQANGIRIRGGGRGGAYTGTANEISFLITNNKVSDFRDNGIFVGGGRGSSHVVSGSVIDNDVRDIGDVVGTGILVQSGEANNTANITLSDIIIRDNKVSNSSGDGVAVFVGFGVGNTVSLSGVTENVTNNNGVDGLVVGAGVLGSGATPISGNRADRNGQDGIDINSTGYVLSNNTASRNAVAGINADAGAVANIDGGGNVAKNNGSCNTPLPASCL